MKSKICQLKVQTEYDWSIFCHSKVMI